jgi:hypothetical protein
VNGKASQVDHIPNIGKLSENTISKTKKWILEQFKKHLGLIPTKESEKELVEKLRALDMADVLQQPSVWYIRWSGNERALIYGNKIALSNSALYEFAAIGFDSTGIIEKSFYDMEAMAENLFSGPKNVMLCGMGTRVEIIAHNQAGNLTRFRHILNREYPYDKPLQKEIRKRNLALVRRCSDPAIAKSAVDELVTRLNELCPDYEHAPEHFQIIKPGRQPKSAEATHFKIKYKYQMRTHSGRLVDTSQEFKANINNEGFTLVRGDITSYARSRKAETIRRTAYAKYNDGMKISRLAANIIETITAEQLDRLMGSGLITFKRDKVSYMLETKKLQMEASIRLEGAVITNKSAQITIIVPQSVADGFVGGSLSKVIEHPLITDDMIITKVDFILGSPLFTYKAPFVFFKE